MADFEAMAVSMNWSCCKNIKTRINENERRENDGKRASYKLWKKNKDVRSELDIQMQAWVGCLISCLDLKQSPCN